MGFIGGGAILRLKDSVRGTATAASLWVTGAIGTSAGVGSFDVAIVLSLTTIITLWTLSAVKEKVDPHGEGGSEAPIGSASDEDGAAEGLDRK